MADNFDPAPLQAFFDEVKEQLGITLVYVENHPKFAIQLEAQEGISRNKCLELLQFIKTQVDLRDNEIGELHANKKVSGKYILDIRKDAAKALAEVYALSTFYPHEEESTLPMRNPKKTKISEETKTNKSRKAPKVENEDEDE